MLYVSGVGTLTRDPELRYIGSNSTPLCSFAMAIHKKVKGEEKTSFIDCKVWGPRAEKVAEWVKKGDHLLVNGSLEQESWEKDGQKRSTVVVNVSDFTFMPKGEKSNKPKNTPPKPTPAAASVGYDDMDEVPF